MADFFLFPSRVLVSHSRLFCMNVNACSESMQNGIINHSFHRFFLPGAMQRRENWMPQPAWKNKLFWVGKAESSCLKKCACSLFRRSAAIEWTLMSLYTSSWCVHKASDQVGIQREAISCLVRQAVGKWPMMYEHTHASLSQRPRRICGCLQLLGMTRASVPVWFCAHICFPDRRKNRRRKGDGGRAGGDGRRQDTQRLSSRIVGVQQSAAWTPRWSSDRRRVCLRRMGVCVCVSGIFTFFLVCVFVSWFSTDVYMSVCASVHLAKERERVCVCVCVCVWRIIWGGRCELWTTNEATDWQLVFVARFALIHPLFPPPHTSRPRFHFDGQYVPVPRQHSVAVLLNVE